MSLVIAYAMSDLCMMIGDTKVTVGDLPQTASQGALKVCLINESLCVGFADKIPQAQEIVRSLFEKQPSDPARFIMETCGENLTSVSLLVLELLGTGPRLSTIINGTLEQNLTVARIGDHSAFEQYQALRLANADSIAEHEVASAFNKLLANGHPTVGGFPIIVRAEEKGFAYQAQLQVHYSSSQVKGMVPEASVSEGGYSFVILLPKTPAPQVAYYCFQAELGLLFMPLKYEFCKVFKADYPKFRELIQQEGFTLGMFATRSRLLQTAAAPGGWQELGHFRFEGGTGDSAVIRFSFQETSGAPGPIEPLRQGIDFFAALSYGDNFVTILLNDPLEHGLDSEQAQENPKTDDAILERIQWHAQSCRSSGRPCRHLQGALLKGNPPVDLKLLHPPVIEMVQRQKPQPGFWPIPEPINTPGFDFEEHIPFVGGNADAIDSLLKKAVQWGYDGLDLGISNNCWILKRDRWHG